MYDTYICASKTKAKQNRYPGEILLLPKNPFFSHKHSFLAMIMDLLKRKTLANIRDGGIFLIFLFLRAVKFLFISLCSSWKKDEEGNDIGNE